MKSDFQIFIRIYSKLFTVDGKNTDIALLEIHDLFNHASFLFDQISAQMTPQNVFEHKTIQVLNYVFKFRILK